MNLFFLFSSPAVKPARIFLFPMQGANKKNCAILTYSAAKSTHERIIRITPMKSNFKRYKTLRFFY